MIEPIATIRFTLGGWTSVATLEADYRWACEGSAALAAVLDGLFPTLDSGPAHGAPGHAAAHKAAEWLGGTLHFTPRHPAPAGTIY